jgi:putative heme-binding domain-containing protein
MHPSIRLVVGLLLAVLSEPGLSQDATYRLSDPQLKLLRIDSDEKESFLGVRLDPAGRLFVGGREGLFVYEPDGKGGFGKRQLLVRFPNHTWVYDVAIRGNDLYVSTVSAIYLIPNGVTQRENLKPTRFVWGIPLGHIHQCFHDMDFGPEGDLYFTCGDPLWGYGDFERRPDHWGHWTWFTSAGEKVEYNGVGGVFRIRPDGTGFKVVARGLRNPIGLTFDSHWNLFTNDNDHEQLPADYVPGRLIHVTPHAYFSWPRGWLPSKQPHRPDLLETMNDHLGRYVPVGEVDYEDTYLPEKYFHSLIVDRWGEHKVVYYPIEPRGASFKAEEHDLLMCTGDARPVGVAVGSGGRIFVTVCYMPANDTSPTYRSDVLVIQRADKPAAITASSDSVDWSRRHAAYEETITPKAQPAGESDRAISNRNPAIQLAGVLALFDRDDGVPQAVIDGPARSSDTYLRQAATILIAEKASLSQIQSLLESQDTPTRLAGVLAAGSRLTIPPATGPLPDDLTLDAKAQAGSYVIASFYDSPRVDLRKLGRVGNYTMAQWWKDARHTDEQERLFSMLQSRLADSDTQIRYEAAFYLNLLNDPRVAPGVADIFHEFEPKSLGPKQPVGKLWAVGPFPDQRRGFNLIHPPEQGPINLAASYSTSRASLSWKRITGKAGYFDFDSLLARNVDSSDYAYFRMESARSQPIILWVGSQQQVRIWQNGRIVWDNWAGRPFKENEDRVPLTLAAGSNDFLIRVHTSAHAILGIAYEAGQPVNVDLPDQLDSQRLAERLAQAKGSTESAEVPPEFAKVDWERAWLTGNAQHGRQLFDSLGCSKCHAITNDAPGGGGPSLAGAGKRFTVPYVVESILLPSKVVSPLFRFTVIRLKNGDILGGLVVSETADSLDLRLQDTTLKTLSKSDIDARKQEDRSPMPQGLVRNSDELKDLLAFILADRRESN